MKDNYGFEYTDGTAASPPITNVAIASPTTIRITLDKPPAIGNERLGYAYTGTPGAPSGSTTAGSTFGNIRDSDATTALSGEQLPIWLVTFNKSVVVTP